MSEPWTYRKKQPGVRAISSTAKKGKGSEIGQVVENRTRKEKSKWKEWKPFLSTCSAPVRHMKGKPCRKAQL